MVGDENADVAIFQAPHDVLNVLHGNGIDAGKRLVEHDEFGVDGQATGNLGATSFAARELVALVLSHFC